MDVKDNNWIFPSNIGLDKVPHYLKTFERLPHNQTITFDLSLTENINSSFIGFLIHAKQITKTEGGKLVLNISPSIEKIFNMLNIIDFLPYVCTSESARSKDSV